MALPIAHRIFEDLGGLRPALVQSPVRLRLIRPLPPEGGNFIPFGLSDPFPPEFYPIRTDPFFSKKHIPFSGGEGVWAPP